MLAAWKVHRLRRNGRLRRQAVRFYRTRERIREILEPQSSHQRRFSGSDMGRPLDLVGQRFDRLLVVERVGTGINGVLWRCSCSCGGERLVITEHLRAWRPSKSIGCQLCKQERITKNGMKHGACKGGVISRLWTIWSCMKDRCTNPNSKIYKYYGGKGVSVCDEWKTFIAFREWAQANGYQEKLSIDRIDSDKGYCPENCEWVTRSENSLRMWASRRAKKAAEV